MSGPVIIRVSKADPCPICAKTDWCGIGQDRDFAICMRDSDGSVCGTANGGWLHRLRDASRPAHPISAPISIQPAPDFEARVRRFVRQTSDARLRELTQALGIPSTEPLRWLRAFARKTDCWGFPMTDARGRVVGIRYRSRTGKKWSARGSRNALFVPRRLDERSGSLMLAEGPTDTAALLALDYPTIGRHSCRGGASELLTLATHEDVVIVADNDDQGRLGAAALADRLCLVARRVRVFAPPSGFDDVRDWIAAGARRDDVDAAIEGSTTWRLGIGVDNDG